MGISDFLGKRVRSRVERFQEAVEKGVSKEERRHLEATLLTPDKIPEYTGEEPPLSAAKPLSNRTVMLVFGHEDHMELFAKHFKVSRKPSLSVTDNGILLALLKGLERGDLIYDEKNKQIYQKHYS